MGNALWIRGQRRVGEMEGRGTGKASEKIHGTLEMRLLLLLPATATQRSRVRKADPPGFALTTDAALTSSPGAWWWSKRVLRQGRAGHLATKRGRGRGRSSLERARQEIKTP